uniref:Uncharacterized protein n=1 Tax=Oryza punctata TaxID=4537 RepID=A0A0E0LFN3_ORYPU
MPAAKKITLLQTVAFAGVFSAVSCWCCMDSCLGGSLRGVSLVESLKTSAAAAAVAAPPTLWLPPILTLTPNPSSKYLDGLQDDESWESKDIKHWQIGGEVRERT